MIKDELSKDDEKRGRRTSRKKWSVLWQVLSSQQTRNYKTFLLEAQPEKYYRHDHIFVYGLRAYHHVVLTPTLEAPISVLL